MSRIQRVQWHWPLDINQTPLQVVPEFSWLCTIADQLYFLFFIFYFYLIKRCPPIDSQLTRYSTQFRQV